MIKILTVLKSNWKLILILSAATSLAGYLWWQNRTIDNLRDDLQTARTNVTVLTNAVETQRNTIESMDRDFQRTVRETQEFNRRIADLREQQADMKQQIDGYRGRLDAISLQRPESAERVINQGLENVFNDFRETTTRPQN